MAPGGHTRRSTSSCGAAGTHARHVSAQQTEIRINVYDLLPPGRLSSLLWAVGGSLLHSGIVISNREYAYGGHSQPGVTGVYYTRPQFCPPGGTFRASIAHGFTCKSAVETEATIREISDQFLGPSYNLLTRNCNHFTNALCRALTGRDAPRWLNRAASVGLALPCMVPREWISPPDAETADGELLEEEAVEGEGEEAEEDEYAHEDAGILDSDRRRRQRHREERQQQRQPGNGEREEEEEEEEQEQEAGTSLAGGPRIRDENPSPPPRMVSRTDGAGRPLPAAERAPVPKTTNTTK